MDINIKKMIYILLGKLTSDVKGSCKLKIGSLVAPSRLRGINFLLKRYGAGNVEVCRGRQQVFSFIHLGPWIPTDRLMELLQAISAEPRSKSNESKGEKMRNCSRVKEEGRKCVSKVTRKKKMLAVLQSTSYDHTT